MNTGDKIYYTGDMANQSGWFKVESFRAPGCVDLVEIGGDRDMKGIFVDHIGTEYQGHCGTRFVTEAAYKEYCDNTLKLFCSINANPNIVSKYGR